VEPAPAELSLDLGAKIGARGEGARLGGDPDPRVDDAVAGAVVDAGGVQHRLHAALAIVEIRLEQHGRFARRSSTHIEIELGHRPSSIRRGRPALR
jgi:hypothetical protein